MQAAARSYRLNQTHEHCKVIYLYAEGTMEQTAVQLMSRKQRAAKLLTGDIGLTGLDALTEGEGGFEEALLDAIGRDTSLLDPSQLFQSATAVSEIDREDAAYWNVEVEVRSEGEPMIVSPDPLLVTALDLGATVTREETAHEARTVSMMPSAYLDSVTLILSEAQWRTLRAELLELAASGASHADLSDWLSANRVVFPGCEREVASRLHELATANGLQAALGPAEQPTLLIDPVKPEHKPSAKIVPFPHAEPARGHASVRQLALF